MADKRREAGPALIGGSEAPPTALKGKEMAAAHVSVDSVQCWPASRQLLPLIPQMDSQPDQKSAPEEEPVVKEVKTLTPFSIADILNRTDNKMAAIPAIPATYLHPWTVWNFQHPHRMGPMVASDDLLSTEDEGCDDTVSVTSSMTSADDDHPIDMTRTLPSGQLDPSGRSESFRLPLWALLVRIRKFQLDIRVQGTLKYFRCKFHSILIICCILIEFFTLIVIKFGINSLNHSNQMKLTLKVE